MLRMTANKISSDDLGIGNVGEYIAVGGVASQRPTLLVGIVDSVSHSLSDNGGVVTRVGVKLHGKENALLGVYRSDSVFVGDDLVEVTRAVLDDLESRRARA